MRANFAQVAGVANQRTDFPFLQPAFWQALQDTQVIGAGSDWPLQVLAAGGACLPLFTRHSHRGEYVFDQMWARAYAQMGLDYYPRLVTSIPYTPVVGPRLWGQPGDAAIQQLWAQIGDQIEVQQASSWHLLFADVPTREAFLEASGGQLIVRTDCQYVWQDQGYGDFEGFLAALTAKRRKNIRTERRRVAEQGITVQWVAGAELTPAHWRDFFACYAMTYAVRGQQPYLPQQLFEQLGQTLPAQLAVCFGVLDGQRVAAALFFRDAQSLYGRYWGSVAAVDFLHFELCYYQGIEYALRHGLRRFDPGTQGEHKLIRGFAPVLTESLHQIAHPRLRAAIRAFCARERQQVLAYQQAAVQALPFRVPD